MSTDMKYSGESNKQMFNYLVRHFPIEFPPKWVEYSNWGKILIDDKTYLLHINKKFLKEKIYSLIEEDKKEFVDTEEKQRDLRKTIKHYIDSARELKND
jgi:hypothetical protein